MKIKSIKRIPFEGTVYNLGVAEDESYVANGIVVHNCRCTLIPITSYEVDALKDKGEGIQISTEDDIPDGFPDPGFKSFSENKIDIEIKNITSPKVTGEDGGQADEVKDFIRFDPNSNLVEGRYRLVSPSEFKPESIHSWDEWARLKAEGIRFIVGDLKDTSEKAVQAVRFNKDKGWTEEKATTWWNTHKDKFRKTWTQEDWDKAKYSIQTGDRIVIENKSFSEVVSFANGLKEAGQEERELEIIEAS